MEKGVNDLTALMPELAAEMADDHLWTNGPQVHTVNSHAMVRWKCKGCGCVWDAQIYTRVRGGAGCPKCRRKKLDGLADEKYRIGRQRADFVRCLPWITMRYYLEKSGVEAHYDYGDRFGIPLDFYLPEKKGAIMIADPLPSKIEQRALAAVCRKSGTTLVYIVPDGEMVYNNCHCVTLADDTPETWNEAIISAMNLMGIEADVDIRRDREKLFTYHEKSIGSRLRSSV